MIGEEIAAARALIALGTDLLHRAGARIEAVTRQPEMRDEITSIQWLGFALTEAIVFYAFIFGLIAFFLSGRWTPRWHSPPTDRRRSRRD